MAEGSSDTVMTKQPTSEKKAKEIDWMEKPSVSGCPPGLEYLTQLDQVVVKQEVELAEVLSGIQINNRYQITNSLGQQCYFTTEDTPCLMRVCCYYYRGFVLHVTDNNDQEVMRIERKFKCCAGCCWCANGGHCSYKVEIQAPVGHTIGYVIQGQTACKPKYTAYTADMEKLATITGPCCPCGTVEFPVMNADGSAELGQITKHWSGLARECFTNADTFNLTFPLDMDVEHKAIMIGALFLIDFMFFEVN